MWMLANPGKDPLDLLVLQSLHDQREGRGETPVPASDGHPFFKYKVWNHWGQRDVIGAGDDHHHHESLNEGSGSQDKDNVDRSHHDNEPVRPGVLNTPDRHGTSAQIIIFILSVPCIRGSGGSEG